MKKFIVIIAILGGLVILYLAYSKYIAMQQAKLSLDSQASQLALMQQTTASQEACKKNWLCSLTAVTDGIGNVFSNVSLF